MKIILPILCLLVVLGVVYGAAKVGILPAQQIADKNAKLAPILRALHLAKAGKKKPAAKMAMAPKPAAVPVPQVAPAAPVAAPAPSILRGPPAATMTAPPAVPAKLSAIYAAMSPDDLARVLAKLPDPAVVQTLLSLDPKKAGKILAALPDTRAAQLTMLMMKTHDAPMQAASAL